MIQFYNAGEFACASASGEGNGSEDGFVVGDDDRTCVPHAGDYLVQDWIIELSELLRLIQLYNLGEFRFCPGVGEDNYCPRAL